MSIVPIEPIENIPPRRGIPERKYPIGDLEVGHGIWAPDAKLPVLRALAGRHGKKLGRKFRCGVALKNGRMQAFLRREK